MDDDEVMEEEQFVEDNSESENIVLNGDEFEDEDEFEYLPLIADYLDDDGEIKKYEDMTDEEKEEAKAALYERETTIGTKTNQVDGAVRKYSAMDLQQLLEDSDTDEVYIEELGGYISAAKDEDGNIKPNVYQYRGDQDAIYTLADTSYSTSDGTFEFNASAYSLAMKTVTDEATETTTEIPILVCNYPQDSVGNHSYVNIPDGITSIDYMFANEKALSCVPVVPDSVVSIHGFCEGCTNCDVFSREAKDGERPLMGFGGDAYMSDNIIDASYAFFESGMKETYAYGGSSLVYTYGEYANSKLDADKNLRAYRGNNDYENDAATRVTEATTHQGDIGQNTGTNSVPKTKNTGISEFVDESGVLIDEDKDPGNSIQTVDETNESIINANFSNLENGFVDTSGVDDVEALSGGASDGNCKDSDGNEHSYNSAYEWLNDNEDAGKKDKGWRTILDYAGMYGIEWGILELITKKPVVSAIVAGGVDVVAGGMLGVLPTTFSGVCEGIVSMCGEDSKIGGALQQVVDWFDLNGEGSAYAAVQDLEETLEAEAARDTYVNSETGEVINYKMDEMGSASDTRLNAALYSQGMWVTTYADKTDENGEFDVNATIDSLVNIKTSICETEVASGELVGRDNVMYTMAATEFDCPSEALLGNAGDAELFADGMEYQFSEWNSMYENGEISEEEYQNLIYNSCDVVLAGFASFDIGVRDGFEQNNENNSGYQSNYDTMMTGLEKTMDVWVSPMLDVMKQYDDILTDEQKEELNKYEITGIDAYTDYEVGSGSFYVTEENTQDVINSLIDKLSEEEIDILLYGNAETDEDYVASQESEEDDDISPSASSSGEDEEHSSLTDEQKETRDEMTDEVLYGVRAIEEEDEDDEELGVAS